MITVRVLGPLDVEVDGRPLRLAGARQQALLALLVMHVNEAVSAADSTYSPVAARQLTTATGRCAR
ncbi:MAG TPA: hypothetical protein VFZ70_09165 [Euzebyales bacterium]